MSFLTGVGLKMVKHIAAIAALALLTAIPACAPAQRPAEPEPDETFFAAEALNSGAEESPERSEDPTPSTAPTPEPTAEPEPGPTPLIPDEWYALRREEMAAHLRQFGGIESEKDIGDILKSREIDPDKPMVALTFDDGPVASVTGPILDILERNNARATFFVLGWRLKYEDNAALLGRMLALGCEIGNHTCDHVKLNRASDRAIIHQITKTNGRIFERTGYTPKSFRPPGGHYGKRDIQTVGSLGMAIVKWSQSGNINYKTPEKIVSSVFFQKANKRSLQDGDIILLHDTHGFMAEAMEILIPKLIEEGYQLVTVQELLNCRCEEGFKPYMEYNSVSDFKIGSPAETDQTPEPEEGTES